MRPSYALSLVPTTPKAVDQTLPPDRTESGRQAGRQADRQTDRQTDRAGGGGGAGGPVSRVRGEG